MYHVGKHPTVLKKLHEEIDKVFFNDNNNNISSSSDSSNSPQQVHISVSYKQNIR